MTVKETRAGAGIPRIGPLLLSHNQDYENHWVSMLSLQLSTDI